MSGTAKKQQIETRSHPRVTTHGILESPEFKAELYQIITEIEPYITDQTSITVTARDPSKLAIQLEVEGNVIPLPELKKMHRVAIVLKENGAQVEAEHLDKNIYEAISGAKKKLLEHLYAVQDEVITKQDRIQQINAVKADDKIH